MNDKSGAIKNTLSLNRVEALTDGVFAIVMTILVLELSSPLISGGTATSELSKHLLELWPKFLSYIVTFLMLGLMWSTHLYQFSFIRRTDSVLVWINIVFLMLMSLLPFSTNILGEYFQEQIAVLIVGFHMSACMLVRIILWAYATGKYRLIDKDINQHAIRDPQIMLLVGISVFIIGMAFSFIGSLISVFIFTIMMLFFIVRFTYLRRITASGRTT